MKQKRILWLDYARCFAIICVVLIHGVERIYAYDAQQTAMLSAGSLLFRNIAFVARKARRSRVFGNYRLFTA